MPGPVADSPSISFKAWCLRSRVVAEVINRSAVTVAFIYVSVKVSPTEGEKCTLGQVFSSLVLSLLRFPKAGLVLPYVCR